MATIDTKLGGSIPHKGIIPPVWWAERVEIMNDQDTIQELTEALDGILDAAKAMAEPVSSADVMRLQNIIARADAAVGLVPQRYVRMPQCEKGRKIAEKHTPPPRRRYAPDERE